MKIHFSPVLQAVKKKPLYFLGSILADLGFFFFYGFVVLSLSEKIADKIARFGFLAAQQGPNFADFTSTVLEVISKDPALKVLGIDMIVLLALMIMSFYFVYTLFQGIAWWCCHQMIKAKPWKEYFHTFFVINLYWIALLAGYKVLDALAVYAASFHIATLLQVASILSFVYLIAWLYVASLSYSMLPKKKAIRQAFHLSVKRKILIPMICVLVVLFIINALLSWLGVQSPQLFLVIGIVLVFPLLSLTRIFMITLVHAHD